MLVSEAILETCERFLMSGGSDGDLCWKWTCHWVEERTGDLRVGSYDSYRCATQRLVGHEMDVLVPVELKKLMLG
jgi:hypothetical protein